MAGNVQESSPKDHTADMQLKELQMSLRSREAVILQLNSHRHTANLEVEKVRDQLAKEKQQRDVREQKFRDKIAATKQEAELQAQKFRHKSNSATQDQVTLQQPKVNFDGLKAAHSAEVDRLHHVLDFYKNASERLSDEVKSMREMSRDLQDSCHAKDKEIQDKESLIQSLYKDISG